MGTSRRKRLGFHTLEVIISIVIAVVVMGVGFSGFTVYNNEMPVKAMSQEMVHVMSTARSMAISRNSFFAFRIDLDEENFWVDEVPDPTNPAAPFIANASKKLESEGLDSRVKIEGVRIGGGSLLPLGIQQVIFGPDGGADEDFRIILYEAGEDPAPDYNVYTVRVYGPTGLAKVFPHARN